MRFETKPIKLKKKQLYFNSAYVQFETILRNTLLTMLHVSLSLCYILMMINLKLAIRGIDSQEISRLICSENLDVHF